MMARLPERLFWSLILLLQMLAVIAELVIDPIRFSLLILFSIICALAMLGLILQRRLYRHNFWAGVAGVIGLHAIVLVLALVVLTLATKLAPMRVQGDWLPLILAAGLLQPMSFLAPLVYLYQSPQIWMPSDPSTATNGSSES